MLENLKNQCRESGSITFWVKVHPQAMRSAATSILSDGTVKIDIAAPPEKGKANCSLIHFLAKEFGVPKSHVEILCGEVARQKRIRVIWRI